MYDVRGSKEKIENGGGLSKKIKFIISVSLMLNKSQTVQDARVSNKFRSVQGHYVLFKTHANCCSDKMLETFTDLQHLQLKLRYL